MVLLVLDASVILKWFFESPEESDRDISLKLKHAHTDGKIKIVVPAYAVYEITNVLRFSKYNFDKDFIFQALYGLESLNLREYHFDTKLLKRSIELSFEYNISVYDAFYVALAEKLKCELVTADKIMVRKVKKELSFVKLLENFEL